MGALAGTITATCYYIRDEIPRDFKERYIEALNKNRFVEINFNLDQEESMGWVPISDPFRTNFDLEESLWGNYLIFALRHDTVRLPATAFKMHLKKAINEYLKESGKQRLSKTETEEIKDSLEKQLKRKALPNIRVYDIVWNLERGVVWLWTTNKKLNELFVEFFQDTFEIQPIERNPYSAIEEMGFEQDALDFILDLEPAALAVDPEGSRGGR